MKKIVVIILLIISIMLIRCNSHKSQVQEKSVVEEYIIVEETKEASSIEYYETVEMSAPASRMESIRESDDVEPIVSEVLEINMPPVHRMGGDETADISYQIKPDSIVQKYELGRLVYDIPNEMQKLTTYHIVVNIARDTLDVRIYDGMNNISVDTIIRTSKTMQVELLDPTGDFFKIVSDTERQFIEIDEHTTWNFYVTPQKVGVSELILNVSIVKDGNLKQKTYGDTVIVKTKAGLELTLWLQKYWQWAFGIFILPLFAYIKKKYFSKKS